MSNETINKRAQLLSDYARSFISESNTEKKGFWSQLKSACMSHLSQTIVVPGSIDGIKKESDYIAEGFIPFCSIGEFRILVRPSDNKREIIICENDSFRDLSVHDWSKCEGNFEAFIIGFVYLSYINIDKDFPISSEECSVIEAFINCLQCSSSTISQAKQYAFLWMMEIFLDDNIVSDQEKVSISKIAKALELSKDDITLIESKLAAAIDDMSKFASIDIPTKNDNADIQDFIKNLQEDVGLSFLKYKDFLNASGMSSEKITSGIEKLIGMVVSEYYQLLKSKKELSQSDITEFSQYASKIGTQQEWIKYYTELLEKTAQNNIIEQNCQNGNLTAIENPPVIMKKGEKAYFVTVAEVAEISTQSKTHRLYAGTRVKLGGIPIYVGGSTPITTSREYLKSFGEADFVITNKRIVISGEKVSYAISLDNLIDVEVFQDAIQLRYEGRYSGRGYIMKEPGLAALVIQTLLSQQETT